MQHYYSKKQTSELNLKKIMIRLKTKEFELYTASGVFSKKRIDKGTKLLIENVLIEPEDNILDLGCGIGVVGISLKLSYPKLKVVMSDVNKRAVTISKKNIKLHKLEDIKALKSDIFSNIKTKFNTILVNPPQTAGKNVCFKIIEDSKKFLLPKGYLQLVARHKKGGSVLEEKMVVVFNNVKQIAKGSGYRVYISENS